jgi:hypothetical protein
MRAIVIAVVVLLQIGCRPFPGPQFAGQADFEATLPHGYQLWRSSARQIAVERGSSVGTGIPPKVVELGHNDDFIIAKQNHLRRRNEGIPGDTYEEPNPGVFSFWILDLRKADAELIGPLSEDEYSAKCSELGVPSDLKLRDVYDYRP